jgi:succinate dehydrogenase / fumarate reductase cytochrome b subunit
MALYAGAILVAGWALALGAGPDAYPAYMDLLASPLGRLVLVGLTLSLFYHLANGIRHLFWDAGYGFELPIARKTGWAATIGAIVLTILLWSVLRATLGGAA